MNADEAYAQCEQITWEQARNFAYGIRLLPPDKRRALAAVYAYARRIDDIGDGDLPAAEKTAQLEAARQQVHALVAEVKGDACGAPRLTTRTRSSSPSRTRARASRPRSRRSRSSSTAASPTSTRPPTRRSTTCSGTAAASRAASGASASASTAPRTRSSQSKLADDLGVALQLTNILRDVREDFLNNRIYLPKEDLDKFGIEFAPFGSPEPFPSEAMQARFANLVEFEANRAREWYGSGLRLLATIDRRSAACTGAMAGIYRRLLERIARNPHAVLDGRMSLPGSEKALVAAQALAGFDRWKYRKGAQRKGALR